MGMELVVGGHYLTTLTAWGDLEWSLCWPGYSDELTFDVSYHPSIFRKQAPVTLMWGGEPMWAGTLDEPVRGQKLRAAGLHRLGDDYASLDGVGALTLNVNTAVDSAILRGLPWTKPFGLGSAVPLGMDSPPTVTEVLAASDAQFPGYASGVHPNGQLLRRQRTTPRLHVRPGGDGLGIAWDNYASTLIARYFTGGAYATVTRTDAAAQARWGYKEVTIPSAVNDGATLTLAQAEAALDSLLANGRARPGWTQAIEVEYGAVLNTRQQAVDLETIKPYETIRVHGLTEDIGDLAGASYVDMPIARIAHDPKARTAVLTPVGLVSPMTDVLTGKKAA